MKHRVFAAALVCLFVLSFGTGLALASSHTGQDVDMKKDIMAAADKFLKMAPEEKYYRFDVKDLKGKTDSGMTDFLIIDVRPAAAFAREHIPMSVSVPLPSLVNQLGTIPMDKTIYAVCAVDSNSAYAAAVLRMLGYTAYMVPGGPTAWKNMGYPVAAGMQ